MTLRRNVLVAGGAGASATLGWNLFGGVDAVLAGLQPQP